MQAVQHGKNEQNEWTDPELRDIYFLAQGRVEVYDGAYKIVDRIGKK
jgi:hypothetical protein